MSINPLSVFSMHKEQENILRSYENRFPNEQNLKIKLTYEQALSELYELSTMPEYKKYFSSMLDGTHSESCHKVLGAWMDKIEGNLKVAFIEDKEDVFNTIKKSFVLNFSITKKSRKWEKLLNFELHCLYEKVFFNNSYDFINYKFIFSVPNINENEYTLNFIFPNPPFYAVDIVPKNSHFTFITEMNNTTYPYPTCRFDEIEKSDLNNIDLGRINSDDPYERLNSHRCFVISYNDIEEVVKQSNNPFQKGKTIKNSRSFKHPSPTYINQSSQKRIQTNNFEEFAHKSSCSIL